jgi:hypothetical protein
VHLGVIDHALTEVATQVLWRSQVHFPSAKGRRELAFHACYAQEPERGRSAVSNMVLALTLVLLWGEKIHLQPVSLYDANAILQTISVRDEHPARAVKNCPWLVLDPKTQRIHLNANQITRAIAVARAFCLKQAPQWDAGKATSESR